MKITICGSIAFYEKMQETQKILEEMGHEVDIPPCELKDDSGNIISIQEYYKIRKAGSEDEKWIWDRKKWAMKKHFDKVVWADAILVLNYAKNNIDGYIGANTLIEMGLALHLDKSIYLLNPIPEISCKEEILGMQPIILSGDLSKIM
ncbi:MAG: hypothetical protein A3J63_04230 [Candidatus Moranbacteria bacterium RIFCSPHIGHO2_02_FULL_40_12b]|nr:MAG: hypothetical protein A3J63_04230 [Candidatus Moranbacteria bacterium RIFCSPHIGHO2_02_FULL_40_12b]OGI23159.1 MAG: hypothetical protein A3E91_03070 [Candidatus Moranbacteria bacterium RIFCSPHIGHO2_12_FULL_40_10]